MAYMTTVNDDQIPDQYPGDNLLSSCDGIIVSDMHALNEHGNFISQNPVDLNAPQPFGNDNDISSSDQLILNQETHFLPDYGTDFASLPVYHDDAPPTGAENHPMDYSAVPKTETNGFYSNLNHPIKSESRLDDEVNAFLTKTSKSQENKLKQDIDNFVKMNSKAADRRMSEDIKAFLRRCRSPSPIESAKSLFTKGPPKSYPKPRRSPSRAPSKSRPLSPIDTNRKSPGRRSRSRTSKPRPVPSRRSTTESKHEKKPLRRSRSKSPLDRKLPKAIAKSKSPEDNKALPLAYRSSLSPSEKKKIRGYSSSPEDKKPFSRAKSPLEKYAKMKSSDDDSDSAEKPLKPVLHQRREESLDIIKDYEKKLEALSQLEPEEIVELEKKIWTKSELLPLFYTRQQSNKAVCEATPKLKALCDKFEEKLIKAPEKIRASKPPYVPPYQQKKLRRRCCHHRHNSSSSSTSSSEDDEEEESAVSIMNKKHDHPQSLHKELWFNDPGQMNDGVLCRCSAKAARSGIRHGIYQGESSIPPCNPNTNNLDRLYHYRITLTPPTNFLTKMPTVIDHDDHEYIFEGFSMFTHEPLGSLPTCKVIRFNINYGILYFEEEKPENFTIRELDLFYKYIFHELLELVDFSVKPSSATGNTCPLFHFMPRFVRELPENGKEILGMGNVIKYLLKSHKLIVPDYDVKRLNSLPTIAWQEEILRYKGMIITYPGAKPSSIRVDQLNRDDKEEIHPEVVHFGIRPPQLSYAGNPEYQKAWRAYVKFRHLIANMPKPSYEDKRKLERKEAKLSEMRTASKMKRGVTVTVSSQNFYATGIMCDVVQHAMLLPVLVCHLRFHRSLQILEDSIGYKFKNRYLLQLAMTHPSFRENFGTNPDHARNSLTNCGIRQPEYGDRRIHYMNTRKRGINTLINIMSRFGKQSETESNISHNERLEFLGDAVVEFVTSIHLYHMFPDLEEGGLATYRAALVQNQHLAVLAKVLNLQDFMLYAHGSDLCHELELRHAMANCFEALMGALFLDGGIEVPDQVFGKTFFKITPELLDVWVNYPKHPLQQQEPDSDRHWISSFPLLQKLTQFEESIGVEFTHIRLLARAFTDRSVGYTNLTLGSNQRMEFLGDTVLQLIASDYLYKYFPEHHEGHLSLLRSSLVNNRTQSVVCDDLNIPAYALYSNPKAELKTKDRADLLESFLGALYIDKGLEYCRVFCDVCFFPRLQDFIMHQDWNDPKSKLQQCCLTLRTLDGGEPDIPIYKVIECKGPTNSRIYTVAVYFRRQRLAEASGHSIQQAEMNAANNALEQSRDLFPQLDHQKRVIAKSMIYNGRTVSNMPNHMKPNHLPNGKFGNKYTIRSRFNTRNKVASNQVRTQRVNKQLGSKAALESKGPRPPPQRPPLQKQQRPPPQKPPPQRSSRQRPRVSSQVVVPHTSKQREDKKFDSEKSDEVRRSTAPRASQAREDSRLSELKKIEKEEEEFESTIKYHTMKEKLNRQIAKEWEEELAESERKEKIRKKISKIKNLGSKAVKSTVSKTEKLEKKKNILKLKKKLRLKLKEKKRLKAKQKAQQKLRKILVSAEKLKRRLQMREQILERQAYEVEIKRKLVEENVKKQNNKLDVERMRMILKGGVGATAPHEDVKTEVGEIEGQKEEVNGPQSSENGDALKVEPKSEILEKVDSVKKVSPEKSKKVKPVTAISSKTLKTSPPPKSTDKSVGKSKAVTVKKSKNKNNLSPIDSDSSLSESIDEKHNKTSNLLNPASPTVKEVSKLIKILDGIDKDKILAKDSAKHKKRLKKKKSSKDRNKSDSDRKSVSSKSSKYRTASSDTSSVERSLPSHHKRSVRESESSKKRKSRKREKSMPKKSERGKRSASPSLKKKLRSPSPAVRKRKSSYSERSSSRKTKSKVRDEPSKVRPLKIRSRSRSHEKKRKNLSTSPKRSHRTRDSRSLSLSLSPPDKRYKTFSKSRSRSPGRFYSHRRSKSRSRSQSPSDKHRKSRSSRADRDEYLKYILDMSQSGNVCAGCTAGTCSMSSSHLVAPSPHPLPMHPPPMAFRPPGAPGPSGPAGPPPYGPPMFGRYPPPGAMRGPPPMRPPRFPIRGVPPRAAPFPGPPMGLRPGMRPGPRPGPFGPGFRPGGPPAGPFFPPGPFPGPPDPNYSGPPNYWT